MYPIIIEVEWDQVNCGQHERQQINRDLNTNLNKQIQTIAAKGTVTGEVAYARGLVEK